jgi:hypothetical protein
MPADGKDEDRPADLRQWLKEEMERRHPEAAQVRSEYSGWLVGFLQVDAAARTAAGIRVEAPEGGPAEALWEPGVHYVVRQVPEADGAWCRCRVMSIFLWDPPVPEAALVTSPARFGDADPDPAVPTWAPGTDGVGPHLLNASGASVRWLLLDGYVYDIRADLDYPPWQKGRWAVNEWRPQTTREMDANPLDQLLPVSGLARCDSTTHGCW